MGDSHAGTVSHQPSLNRSSTASADSVMTWTETTTASETMSKQHRTSWTASSYIQLPTVSHQQPACVYALKKLLPWACASGVAVIFFSISVEKWSGLEMSGVVFWSAGFCSQEIFADWSLQSLVTSLNFSLGSKRLPVNLNVWAQKTAARLSTSLS